MVGREVMGLERDKPHIEYKTAEEKRCVEQARAVQPNSKQNAAEGQNLEMERHFAVDRIAFNRSMRS